MSTKETMALPRKTPTAARILGRSYAVLIDLVRFGHIAPPAKDSSGHYVWSDGDIEAARRVLAARDERRRETAVRLTPAVETRAGA